MRVRVYNGSEQAESVPAEMSENGRSRRKRVPKQCDCCGPNGKGHATGHHQIAKKRGRRRAEPVSEVEVATDNHVSSAVVDLVSTPEPDEITVWEVQQAMLCDPTTTLSEAGPPASDSTALHNGIVVSREDSPEANRKDPMSLSDSKKPHSDTHVSPTEGTHNLDTHSDPLQASTIPPFECVQASTTANGDRSETPAAPVTQSDCLGLDQMVDDNAMEVEHAIFPVYLNTKALWDHRYCKRGGHWEAVSTEELPDLSQSSSAEVQDDHIVELIHEFLENFYEKKKMISTEVMKYKSGLACAPMNFFKVTYNKHILALDDLATLDDQNWVNDQIINMYGELIMETTNHKIHFFNSFFYRQLVAKGYEGVKRWTKKVDLFSKRLLLVPVHLEIHWSLITVDVSKQNINFYDSQGILFKFAVDNILKYILAEAKEKKQTAFQKGWKMTVNKYCKCLAFKEPLLFTQEDMPKVRKRIYKELCDCKLLDVPKPV
ncbi:hypothetical protein P4O66_012823 [Electrophorus voltai]|uniref:Ubiquitin-like protease family profile domain-containing protein n=1 Tax=Electrophorus voltai TaxID=2609070 RepID=A0AAD9E8U7_9TELE|nr:hypothetical protein P4O66_012823 [Electrophorus voltai]